MLSYSFEDDPMITRRAVDSLNRFYTSATITRRHVAPADVREKRIGHFGYFSERSAPALWRESLDWLRRSMA